MARLTSLPLSAAALIAVSLLAATSGADAPSGHFTVGSGAAAGTVLDNATKLTWQQGNSPSGLTSAGDAFNYCHTLTLNGTGWRVPRIMELLSLVDYAVPQPSIDATAFPNTPAVTFFSSTIAAGRAPDVWAVQFNGGGTGYGSTSGYVRCVR